MRASTLLLALIITAVLAVFFIYQTESRDAIDSHLCAQEYSNARTARDSAKIDARPPMRERGRGEYTTPQVTCGELRRIVKVR